MEKNKQCSNRKVHEEYHKKTKSFAKIIKDNDFTYRTHIKILERFVKSPKTVLDIGCGAGTIVFYLTNKDNIVTGIDISQKAITECIRSAKELNMNARFIRADFQKQKINNKFDVVILTEVIEHLKDDYLALEAINKLLKPNGVLILSTPSINAPLHRLGMTKQFDVDVGHLRRYSLKQLHKLLRENNFKIIESKKTEGILRNFLFVNPYAGKLIRYVNFFASDFVTFLDNISLKLFGPSNYIIVAKKIDSKKSGKE